MHALQQNWPADAAARYREAGYWTGETFPWFIRHWVDEQPDHIAVVGDDTRWTYAELWARIETIASGFLAAGLQPGDRVVVQLGNVPEFLSAALGLSRVGLIPLFALPAHRRVEVVHFARAAEARAIVVGTTADGFDYGAQARAVRDEVDTLEHVFMVGDAGEHGAHVISVDAFASGVAALPDAKPDPASVALVQISGGTSGLSKLIPRTHDDYIYSFRASADICELSPDSVYLGALPVAHNFPMSSPGVFGVLHAGGTVVMSPTPNPADAFRLIERERVTITGLVPPLALLWMRAAADTDYDISSLEVLQVGGAKFIPEAAKRVRPTLHCTLQQVFGMAEGLVNYTRLDDPEDIIVNTQGRPISAADEVRVVDDHDQPVADGTPGHLLTRGPYTIHAYHNDAAANARAFTDDGFYRTGDIVSRDAAGYLVVRGRATDHINRAGEKVSAEEVEDHLLAHPQVFDAAVVAVPDEHLGERSCAFVIPDGKKPRSIELKRWMRTRDIAAFKVPDQIIFVDAFQTTAVGKVSRRELRAELRARLLAEQEA